jgi:site-specific DNA recombinase
VQDIFALFLEHRSLLTVLTELARRRWKTKSRTLQSGRAQVGRAFTKASLRLLLTNAVYSGQVEHRGVIYQREHASIIEPSVWQGVNAQLRDGRRTGTGALREPQNALLAGLLLCKSCQCPIDTHLHGQAGPQVSLLRMQSGSTEGMERLSYQISAGTDDRRLRRRSVSNGSRRL